MIIDKIAFHNFGVFRGRHEAELTPKSDRHPIVLFGGLNGCGKTTLLEGLQLALHGKLSPAARAFGRGYEEYLRGLINRSVRPSDGASVEVEFRAASDGALRSYRVRRSWAVPAERVSERLDIFIDGRIDKALSESWAERVAGFIPAELSHLFFFDGERIEALADPDQSSQMLNAAIRSLLGVDLVDQLGVDLRVLERRKLKSRQQGPGKSRVDELDAKEEEIASKLDSKRQAVASARNNVGRTEKRLREADARFQQHGGDRVAAREELEKARHELQAESKSLRAELIHLSSGALPLSLCKELLTGILAQGRAERQSAAWSGVEDLLEDRDKQLLKIISNAGANESLVAEVTSFFEADSKERSDSSGDIYLDISAGALESVENLSQVAILREQQRSLELLKRLATIEEELDAVERQLATVPDEEAIAQLLASRDECTRALAIAESTLRQLEEETSSLEQKHRSIENERDQLLYVSAEKTLDNADLERFVKHSQLARGALDRFKHLVVESHATRLESLILDGYRQLLRKSSLVVEARLDPETSRLDLLDKNGKNVPAESLSAGERQLLAVSMLWGLGRASGKVLPAIIDTPLGRLDAAHRTNLIERYFPYASHQVLLLSTDEEITERYYEKLKPWIGREYVLHHDDKTSTTSIEPGYFW